MDASQILANALPMMMAYVVMWLRTGIPQLTESTVRVILPDGVRLEGHARTYAVELAIHVYRQLSFVVSLLLSTVSALALTLTSNRKIVAGIVVFLLLSTVVLWLLRWQTLSANPAQIPSRTKQNAT